MANYLKPVAAILLPSVGGLFGRLMTRSETRPGEPSTTTWFKALKKPAFQPPSWLVLPVWTSLHCSMGYASYMVWRDGGGFSGAAAIPLACYGVSLALNWSWGPIFFKYRNLGLALCDNLALCGAVLASIVTFHKVNPTAAYILIPYLGWISFTSIVTFYIWRNNRNRMD